MQAEFDPFLASIPVVTSDHDPRAGVGPVLEVQDAYFRAEVGIKLWEESLLLKEVGSPTANRRNVFIPI